MGLVLVFDLDQTIIDSSDPYLFNRPNTPDGMRIFKSRAKYMLNFRLVNDVIKRAVKLRGLKDASGNDKLSGIFLLTNNSSKLMVSGVNSVLIDEVSKETPNQAVGKYMTDLNKDPDTEGMPDQPYFFDSILMREHSGRTLGADPHNPLKNLEDVKKMLGFIGVEMSEEELKRNTFFFDDMDHPGMTLGGQYIKISPPFKKWMDDDTNYTPILQRLSELDGQPLTKPLPSFKPIVKSPLTISRMPSKPLKLVKQRTYGRNRSNTMNNRVNNMELPLSEQETKVRPLVKSRPSISSIFTNKPSKGGSRTKGSSRTRKNGRNKTRKSLRK